jgi:serine/threonine-protein kinase PknG
MRCRRAGCPGSYGADGYCDECGRRAASDVTVAGPGTGAASGEERSDGGEAAPQGFRGPRERSERQHCGPATTGTAAGGGATVSEATVASGGRGRTRSSTRGRLGAGLVEVPRITRRDPQSAVLADPQVPERRRFCSNPGCERPVGRGRAGQPGYTSGFCPNCRKPYSFVPRLSRGDLIGGRYEILGCLAHGGLGWIYLARDRNVSDRVSDRWVVLKGLIDTGDPDAMAAAVNERRFLVDVDHPNIVKIHDFAQHPDRETGTTVGYIVMEYVGGQSLRDLLLAVRDAGRAALPLPQVLAYGLEVLPALGHLHERGLLFCDFKPDNVIHADDQLKLIDLGAVRHLDDDVSAIYGTPGYQAPEVATVGASIAADLYTVGRALAVLSFGFSGFTTTYLDRLPERAQVRLLTEEESFDRLLRRATHRDPRRRFGSAAEMAEQMRGVLREVLAATDHVPRPEPSAHFTRERRVFGTDAGLVAGEEGGGGGAAVAAALPLPQVDLADPGAGLLATVGAVTPGELVAALQAAPVRTVEVALRLVRARVDLGDLAGAGADLDRLAGLGDWRVDWFRALAALAAERYADARVAFEAVYSVLPGELAPKLALAAAEERDGAVPAAIAHYERVWHTDHDYVSAAFGLAGLRLRHGDRAGCVAVLDEVPDTSSQHVTAQVAAVRARVGAELAHLAETDLMDASARVERLRLGVERNAWLAVEMLERSLMWVRGRPPDRRAPVAGGRVLGHELREPALRLGLEQAYRALAKLARDEDARVRWVDQANRVRPRTWI